ncbi:MAG: hypothetical protein ACI8XX_002287 [Polaribacter sp.]|jgi:thymidylate kinase
MTSPEHSAWNPGIESDIPAVYKNQETIYLTENTGTGLNEILELAQITGLSHEELIYFHPERLVLHEVIIRVTAEIAIMESDEEEDLGITFRQIADKILNLYIQPHMGDIGDSYQAMQQQARSAIEKELKASLFTSDITTHKHKKSRLNIWPFTRVKKLKATVSSFDQQEREFDVISGFKQKGLAADDALTSAMYRSLYRVLGAIANKRGYLGQDMALLVELSTRHVSHYYGARLIGEMVHRLIIKAISEQSYPMLPDADKAILISLKGTSAAGKSSLRPSLRKIMKKIGIEGGCYATVSPDIWRRMLLDYDSLGDAYKYAGRFTSREVNIIDSKLDQYIRGKADKRQAIPHLMVDRFRFDSFNSAKVTSVLHKTYVKYIDTMYMYFVITPPEATVERGWKRGQDRGRYKSVEDFLGHSVEAYEGIPKLLFKWLSHQHPKFIFEFLDNDVPIDHFPSLIANGTQGSMNIFDPMGFVNIERYQKINVMAKTPDEVYFDTEKFSVEKNLDFLKHCISKIDTVQFTDPNSNITYLSSSKGSLKVEDPDCLASFSVEPTYQELFRHLLP